MDTRDIVFISLFAAVMAALATVPPVMLPAVGVPITAQSLGTMLAGGVLGAKRGGLAIALFLLLVALGLPLLSGGHGGAAVFLGPTGGYLFGWILAAIVTGFLTERLWHRLNYGVAAANCFAGGILVLYAAGVPWSAFVAKIPLPVALLGSLPFLVGDAIKCLVAAAVIVTVKRTYPIITSRSITPRATR